MPQDISQERLKELFTYDPDTGYLINRMDRGKARSGMIAGTWSKRQGYRYIKINYQTYIVHRIIWLYFYGEWPESIDHINGVRDDNRIINLRNVSQQENLRNRALTSRSQTGIHGVHWRSIRNKYRSYIAHNHKFVTLGHFDDFFEACCARKSAEHRYGYHPNHGRLT